MLAVCRLVDESRSGAGLVPIATSAEADLSMDLTSPRRIEVVDVVRQARQVRVVDDGGGRFERRDATAHDDHHIRETLWRCAGAALTFMFRVRPDGSTLVSIPEADREEL